MFIMVVDWIMREDKDQRKTVLQWTLTTQLHNLDNADDVICLFSQKLQHVKAKTNNPILMETNIGLRISITKNNVIRTSNKQNDEMN